MQREVRRLADAGIIRRTVRDRHVYFQADPACPVFAELRGLVTQTIGAAAVRRARSSSFGLLRSGRHAEA